MTKAFVFGKFLPFHKGHETMIEFALTKCDFLTILVCAGDRETIPGNVRKSWIESTFGHLTKLEVQCFNYLEHELPNTSESSRVVSKQWAEVFKTQFPEYLLLITSEEYGKYVADFMDIRHIAFDIPKRLFPVSATAINNDLFTNWNYLPDSVKPWFAIKVVVVGTESTGKSSLAEKLAGHFNCSLVQEAARDIIARSDSFSFEDLHLVAAEHAARIDKAVLGDSPLVIVDTDIHTTISYSERYFGKKLSVGEDIFNSNKAQLYLYLDNDVEYIQDGTRLSEAERNLLDASHRLVLKAHGIEPEIIDGNWTVRFEKAVKKIDELAAIKRKVRFWHN